ncbi:hypothetical protein T492DRAFT_837170 [Pavlovales sp. CCMP2436]|nr:hypothetical protein T492DRAFT_837170 [Pavlovales sp. CCMP2436]
MLSYFVLLHGDEGAHGDSLQLGQTHGVIAPETGEEAEGEEGGWCELDIKLKPSDLPGKRKHRITVRCLGPAPGGSTGKGARPSTGLGSSSGGGAAAAQLRGWVFPHDTPMTVTYSIVHPAYLELPDLAKSSGPAGGGALAQPLAERGEGRGGAQATGSVGGTSGSGGSGSGGVAPFAVEREPGVAALERGGGGYELPLGMCYVSAAMMPAERDVSAGVAGGRAEPVRVVPLRVNNVRDTAVVISTNSNTKQLAIYLDEARTTLASAVRLAPRAETRLFVCLQPHLPAEAYTGRSAPRAFVGGVHLRVHAATAADLAAGDEAGEAAVALPVGGGEGGEATAEKLGAVVEEHVLRISATIGRALLRTPKALVDLGRTVAVGAPVRAVLLLSNEQPAMPLHWALAATPLRDLPDEPAGCEVLPATLSGVLSLASSSAAAACATGAGAGARVAPPHGLVNSHSLGVVTEAAGYTPVASPATSPLKVKRCNSAETDKGHAHPPHDKGHPLHSPHSGSTLLAAATAHAAALATTTALAVIGGAALAVALATSAAQTAQPGSALAAVGGSASAAVGEKGDKGGALEKGGGEKGAKAFHLVYFELRPLRHGLHRVTYKLSNEHGAGSVLLTDLHAPNETISVTLQLSVESPALVLLRPPRPLSDLSERSDDDEPFDSPVSSPAPSPSPASSGWAHLDAYR